VYNSVAEAMNAHGQLDASVVFVPAPQVKAAVFEALEAGIKFVVIPSERVPLHDSLQMIALARRKGARMLGPGSLGVISSGKAIMGWIGGTEQFAREVFKPGSVGIMSRSGGQTTTVAWSITQRELGISTALHVGAEPVVGLNFAEILPLFEADPQTQIVVMFGEIGTVAEEEAAEVIKESKFAKPLVAYIAGRSLPAGVRFSHASAIIERGRGTAESKVKALGEANAYVVDRPQELAETVHKILRR
jgi:succinyl-CoA synthetase alpha subunit